MQSTLGKRLREDESHPLTNDAAGLVRLITLDSVKKDSMEIIRIVGELEKITRSDEGKIACMKADAPSVLVSLTREISVKESGTAVMYIAATLDNIASRHVDDGVKACIAAGVPSALTTLSREMAVKKNSKAARFIAEALWSIARIDVGYRACLDVGVQSALQALAHEKVIQEDENAILWIAGALEITLPNQGKFNFDLSHFKGYLRYLDVAPVKISEKALADLENQRKTLISKLRVKGLVVDQQSTVVPAPVPMTKPDSLSVVDKHANVVVPAVSPSSILPQPLPAPTNEIVVLPSHKTILLNFLITPPDDFRPKVRDVGITLDTISEKTLIETRIINSYLKELHSKGFVTKKKTDILSYTTKKVEDLKGLLRSINNQEDPSTLPIAVEIPISVMMQAIIRLEKHSNGYGNYREAAKKRIERIIEEHIEKDGLVPAFRLGMEAEPVYLATFTDKGYDFGNFPKDMKPQQAREQLLEWAGTWKEVPFDLKPFFVPKIGYEGFRENPDCKFEIDHVLPKAWFGIDHPRNYVIMAASLNASFKHFIDEKISLLSPTTLRHVHEFLASIKEAVDIPSAIAKVVKEKRVGYQQ